MIPTYPNDSLQYYVDPWWVRTEKTTKDRWRFGWALVRHISETPYTLEVMGRTDPKEHEQAELKIVPLDVKLPPTPRPDLPVAAMPLRRNELYCVQRGKIRPVMILAKTGTRIEPEYQSLLRNKLHYPLYLVAPYYSVDQDGTRGGIPPEFIPRLKSCEYSQYMWEILPDSRSQQSVLRLDQIQPIEPATCALDCTNFKLSDDAGMILDEWIMWHLRQVAPSSDSMFAEYKKGLAERPSFAASTE